MIYLFIIFLAFGILLLCLDYFKVATVKNSKTVLKIINYGKVKSNFREVALSSLAYKLIRYVYINDYKKEKLKIALSSANVPFSPEMFIARIYAKMFYISLLIIPSFFVFKLLVPVVIILCVALYFEEYNKPYKIIDAKRQAIEYDLPRFANVISQELQRGTIDVIKIFENYKESVSDVFKAEITRTIADMNTRNYQRALLNFEKRINSSMLSEIVRTLISTVNGDDNVINFRYIAMKLKKIELENLKKEAIKQPDRIKRYSIILLVAFMLIVGVIIMTILSDVVKEVL